jgi:hypothetical protein
VKGVLGRDDLVGAAAMLAAPLPGQLDRPLVRLGAELAKNTRPPKLLFAKSSASSAALSLKNPGLGLMRRRACRAIASAMTGGQCPRQLTAQPWMKSRSLHQD